MRPNKPKTSVVILTILGTPILLPLYVFGILCAIVHVTVYCGYKNAEKKWLTGFGYEDDQQIMERLLTEKLKQLKDTK